MTGNPGRVKAMLLAAGMAVAAVPSTASAQASTYDIQAQELGSALNQLARQSNREIYFAAELTRGKRVATLRGTMSLEQALATLLNGTKLHYRMNARGAIVIEPQIAAMAEEPVQPPEDAPETQIVVTGTLIRGVAPKASPSVSLSRDEIESKAPSSTDQLLRSIPQMTTFNTVSAVGTNVDGGGGQNALSVNFTNQTQKPSLRNLTTGGGPGSTLILIDGHRVAGAGIFGPSVDPDIVSPAVLERIEVVLDGGSALYGSDAVGGVINIVTRRHYDGLELDARYGAADSYHAVNANATFGHAWSTGSAYLSYGYASRSDVLGKDRNYIQSINWVTGIPTGRQCAVGNTQVSTRIYGLPRLGLNAPNVCDPTDYQTVVPKERRHNVFAGISQDIDGRVKLDVRGFYSLRNTEGNAGPLATSVNVRPTNPFYITLPGESATATQSVQFNYAPINGNAAATNLTRLEQWGITPSVTIDLSHGWELRAFSNISESRTTFRNAALNTDLQTTYAAGTTTNTAINPYDIAATPNQQLIANILNWQRYGFGLSRLVNHRAVLDGPLFTLPGGPARIAVGLEYLKDSFLTRSGFSVRGGEANLLTSSYSRSDVAVFGELNLPFVGPDSENVPIHALSFTLSLRRDAFSDVGATTNPKIGVVLEPTDWLRLRASWGRSFNAPTASDQLASLANTLTVQPFALITPPNGPAPPPGSFTIVQFGAVNDLRPQRATSLSYGFDLSPPWVPGLSLSGTIYQVRFSDQLGNPPFFNASEMFTNFPQFVTLFPDSAAITAAAQGVAGGAAQVAQFLAPGGPKVYAIIDARSRNLGVSKVRGLDFAANYRSKTRFGSIDLGLSGNYQLSRSFSNSPTTALVPVDLSYFNRLRLSANAGATIGNLRAQVTWNHLGGYRIAPSATVHQDSVDAFNVVNLFFKYDIPSPPLARKLAVTLNIDNLFGQDPPTLRSDGSTGITNGSTLGRFVQLGFNAKF